MRTHFRGAHRAVGGAATAVLYALVLGCDTVTMKDVPGADPSIQNLPKFAVVGDVATVADVPSSQRPAEIAKAFEAILARIPEEKRAEARTELEEPFIGMPVATIDPESARLWSRIVSLRLADARESRPRAGIANAIPNAAIRVALVASVEDQSARAVVVRRPDDNGVPLVLVPTQTASGEALMRGLQAAERTLRTYKPTPGKSAIVTVRFGAKRKEPTPNQKKLFEPWEAAIVALRNVGQTDVPGVGPARTVMMLAPGRVQVRPRND